MTCFLVEIKKIDTKTAIQGLLANMYHRSSRTPTVVNIPYNKLPCINPRCKLTAWDGLYHDFWDKYINRKRVEEPDIVIGIHPGLHADGVYEYWEPTLELLLDKEIVTVFTVLSEEEYQMTLQALDALFCKYIHKGKNAFASNHVKQTIHDADLMWASNMYVIIFKVNKNNFY